MEGHQLYRPLLLPLFDHIHRGIIQGLSSYITLLEVLIKPIRMARHDLITQYRDILTASDNFALHPVDREIAEQGASIRAMYNFRSPDAIQLATAIVHGAEAFVTNDRRLRGFDRMDIVIIGEHS